MSVPDLLAVDGAAWEEARRCLSVIRRLAEDGARTRAKILAAARELGCGPTHVYALLPRYADDPRLTSLLPRMRGRRVGHKLLDPAVTAIAARVKDRKARQVVAKRHGRKAARDLYAPIVGSLVADYPLSLVQIDHTLVDVIVVDTEARAPIQRPWLTLAIDVHSRCVAGFYLSLEPPSATSVALCLAHAALPKEAWLAERGIAAE